MRFQAATGLLLALLWLLAMAPGCVPRTSSSGERSLRVLGGSLYCGRTEPTSAIGQAGDEEAYARLLASSGMDAAQPDFPHEIAILVALGERPTLGYQIEPETSRIPVQNGTAILPIVVHEPSPDALVGQAITSPCLMLALERSGISVVEARDQHGHLLGRTSIE